MRTLKDGWVIHREWVGYKTYDEKGQGSGRRTHYVETDCSSCSTHTVNMPLSKLVKDGSEQCDGCEAYSSHLK